MSPGVSRLIDDNLGGLRKRRSSFGILAEILEIAKRGAGKTNIMYSANLSFAQANNYLSFLLDRNLLKLFETSRAAYKTTDKGLRYLRQYKEIIELLKH